MSEEILISPIEHKNLVDFSTEKIDHVFIHPHDESNPTLICHGGNGRIFYNGCEHTLSEIIDDVKKELHVDSKYFYLDVACCYASQLLPYIKDGCTIRPRYLTDNILSYCFDSEHIKFKYN